MLSIVGDAPALAVLIAVLKPAGAGGSVMPVFRCRNGQKRAIASKPLKEIKRCKRGQLLAVGNRPISPAIEAAIRSLRTSLRLAMMRAQIMYSCSGVPAPLSAKRFVCANGGRHQPNAHLSGYY